MSGFESEHAESLLGRDVPFHAGSETEGRAIETVRRFAESYGVSDPDCAAEFARRVVERVDGEPPFETPDGEVYLRVARRWVEEFCRKETDQQDDWFFRARSLLARFPHALLATQVPFDDDERTLDLVPTQKPSLMRQQHVGQHRHRASE